MTTINVLDAAGSPVALEKPLVPGQASSAASRPVVIASDQSAVPVSDTVLDAAIVSQGTALGSIKELMTAGSVTTAAPTYTTGQISPLSIDTTGALRVNVTAGGAGGGVVTQATGTNLHTVVDSGTITSVTAITNALPAGTNVIGHVVVDTAPTTAVTIASLPSGAVTNAGTFAVQDTVLDAALVSQGTALGTIKTAMVAGSVTTASPTYTTGQINPLSLDTTGALRVNVTAGGAGGGVVTQATGTNLHVVVDTAPTTAVTIASLPSGAVTNAGTFAVQDTVLDAAIVSQGTALGSIKQQMIAGSVTTAAPTYTTGQINPLSLDTTGALRVNVTAGGAGGGVVTQATGTNLHTVVDSGTVTAVTAITNALPAGTNVIGHVVVDTAPTTAVTIATAPALVASSAIIGQVKLVDTGGTNVAAIKAASTAPLATDPSLVVSISPNSVNANGQNTKANSSPVAPASDWVYNSGYYVTVAASQTATVLQSTTGATGDYLHEVTVIPATTAPGVVTIIDNATTIIGYPGGGTTALLTLTPFTIYVGAVSRSGAWKITTGANVSVKATGRFS